MADDLRPTPPNSEAVNLARTWLDKTPGVGEWDMTKAATRKLAEAVIAMDEFIGQRQETPALSERLNVALDKVLIHRADMDNDEAYAAMLECREIAKELSGTPRTAELHGPEDDPVVVEFPGQTLLGIAPGKIAKAAEKADLKYCLILGVRRDGSFYFASSDADVLMALWQLKRAERALFEEIKPEKGMRA